MVKRESPRTVRLAARCGWVYDSRGFTLLEVIVVVLILALAAAMAVPLLSSGAGSKGLAAAQMIAADLEYARSMAFTRGHFYRVTFNAGAAQYQVEDENGAVVIHPVSHRSYVVSLAGGQLDGVEISGVDFDGTSQVRFDALGSPYNGHGNPLNEGVIHLQAGSTTQTIRIEPVTGLIRIDE